MKFPGPPVVLALSSVLFGCAVNPTLYQWGKYEQTLHEAYKNPEAIPEFQAELRRLIDISEETDHKIPPGVYAEYGYAVYLTGKLEDAIVYFAREREKWPESVVLMTTIIQRLEKRIEEEEGKDAARDERDGSSQAEEVDGAVSARDEGAQ